MTISPRTWLSSLPIGVETQLPDTLNVDSVRATAYGPMKSGGFTVRKAGTHHLFTRGAAGDFAEAAPRQVPADVQSPRPGMALTPEEFAAAAAALEPGDSVAVPDSVDYTTVTPPAGGAVRRTPWGWRLFASARADDSEALAEVRRLSPLDSIDHHLDPGVQDAVFAALEPRKYAVKGVRGSARIWRTR